VSEDVRVHGYFSKPEGVRKQKRLGNTGLNERKMSDSNLIYVTDCPEWVFSGFLDPFRQIRG